MKTLAFSLVLLSTQAFAVKPIPEKERISALLQGSREYMNLTEMHKLGLNTGAAAIDLWSGSYWPHYQGALGIRYRDPSFIALMEGKAQYDKFKELREKKPLYTYSGNENLLSPAEKYDLVVGDTSMALTKYTWELGEKANKFGKVPLWRGICDGWSSAAQMMPRPTKSVVMKTPKGVPITFFPEDIKALGSQLYARAQDNVIFIGKRCQKVIGVFTGSCDGTNPGAFHKSLASRVGGMKKTFNVDISSNSEVWNYPVKSYKFTYYNVFTEEESPDFQTALERFDKKSKFDKAGRRHEKTHAIVGVKAEVTYADMREANLLDVDSKVQDKDLVKTYRYDLELDYNSNILGGEWMSEMPDFIWAPNDLQYPISEGELKGKPLSAFGLTKAAQVSSKVGQPLSVIVEQLFEQSK